MNKKMLQATIEYLESIITYNPVINAQNMGECLYCGVALDEGKPHKEDCHYLEAQRLLAEFKKIMENLD